MSDYDRAIQLDPNVAVYWHNRGFAKESLGDFAGAVSDYDRAIQLDPNVANYWGSRADLKEKRGDLAGAVADFEQARRRDGSWSDRYSEAVKQLKRQQRRSWFR